jgi:hypothetical protein
MAICLPSAADGRDPTPAFLIDFLVFGCLKSSNLSWTVGEPVGIITYRNYYA